MLLKDQVAIVTGSSRGIGAATAKLLAENGAAVAVNFLENRARAEQVLAEIQARGGRGILVQADVTVPEQVEALVRLTEKDLGPVDILVNNANIGFPMASFLEIRWEDLERKLVGELGASFLCCRAVAGRMAERRRGCIVNVSSGLSRHPGFGFVAHCTAKAALDAFSRSLALELGPLGIRVNVVSPGLIRTDATAFTPKEAIEAVVAQTPLGRLGEPEDVAGAVLFFCLDWSRFVSGVYLPVCGGSQML